MNINNKQLKDIFQGLSTPLIADAIVRLGIKPRIIASGIQPLISGTKIAGKVFPVKHFGSVDVFFKAMTEAQEGDILIIDNQGRKDEGCIGDLTVLEAQAFKLQGIIVWGCHRDTKELIEIGFPVFSYGKCPFGPLQINQREAGTYSTIQFDGVEVGEDDVVFADDDGIVLALYQDIKNILSKANEINETEINQANAIKNGQTLHEHLQFDEYLIKSREDRSYTFRKHLKNIGGAIEE